MSVPLRERLASATESSDPPSTHDGNRRNIAARLNVPVANRKKLKEQQSRSFHEGVDRLFDSIPYFGHLSDMVVMTAEFPKLSRSQLDCTLHVREVHGHGSLDHVFTNRDSLEEKSSGHFTFETRKRPQMSSILEFIDMKLRSGQSTTLQETLQEYVDSEAIRARKRVRVCADNRGLEEALVNIEKAGGAEELFQLQQQFETLEDTIWSETHPE